MKECVACYWATEPHQFGLYRYLQTLTGGVTLHIYSELFGETGWELSNDDMHILLSTWRELLLYDDDIRIA